MLLRMKLAEAALLRQVRSEAPVLLLDDALSDMDPARRGATLEVLRAGGQVFLSVPERPGDPGARGAVFQVASGAAEMVA
jgi:DNA replication and repair protein RecF